MNINKLRELLKKLNITMRCPHCDKKYDLDEISLKGYIGNTYFLRLVCYNCHTPVYATIAINNQKQELISHLKTREDLKPIDNDEIIELHQFLENFDGDFRKILE